MILELGFIKFLTPVDSRYLVSPICNSKEYLAIMYQHSKWYQTLLAAKKTCLKEDIIKKFHYKFDDGNEMVEEYNAETQVLLRRTWKIKGNFGAEGKWSVEIGDPIPNVVTKPEPFNIKESYNQPVVSKRNTKISIEWRIRNLRYPIETYSVIAKKEENVIIVSTSNKKYYKKLEVPELTRIGLCVEQSKIQIAHKFNTLIVTHAKPQALLDMEKALYEELNKVKSNADLPSDCRTQ